MMKQVKIDRFFIALSMGDDEKSSDASSSLSSFGHGQLEQLRTATIHYLLEVLKPKFPSLAALEMTFANLSCGSGRPEPKFQIYWEVDAIGHFHPPPKGRLVSTAPKADKLFKALGPAFDQGYFDYIRNTLASSSPLLAAANEVLVRQVKKDTAGGAVKAPPFYISFVCGNQRPNKQPSEKQIEKLINYSFPRMVDALKTIHKDDFQDMTLRVVKTDINEDAGKPVDTFNIYIEFEAVGTFAKNSPEPMQFYSDLSSFDTLAYLMGVGEYLGGYFKRVERMAINPCAWVENEVEEMDDPAEDAKIVPVHVEFWVAQVMPNQKENPSKEENICFDQMIQDKFVTPILVGAYGKKKIVQVKVTKQDKEGMSEFQTGVPLPRFNVLHRYQVDIEMTNPIPLPAQVLAKIIRGGNLLGDVLALSSPWNDTREVTLGVAGNENPGKEETFGSKIKSPPPPPPSPVPSKAVVVSPPLSPSSSQEKPKKKKPKQSSPPPKAPVIATRKTTVKEKKKKAEPESEPSQEEKQPQTESVVLGADVFLALTLADGACDSSGQPTKDDYAKLEHATFGFYTDYLRELHGDNFLEFRVSVRKALANASIPSKMYNIYVEWHLSATFADATKAPSRVTFCQQLVHEIDTMDYLKNRVRSLTDTPFGQAFRMYTEQIVET